MNEMIERVALAIYKKFENRPLYAQIQMNNIIAEELAHVAIEAMREPTKEMIKASAPAFQEVQDMILYCHARGSHRGGLKNGDPVPIAWRAMINAALKED